MITSRDNPHLKQARAVRKGKIPGQMFIEGLRLCEETVRSGTGITQVLYTSDFALEPRGKSLLAELKKRDIHPLIIPEKLLASITDTKSPQGIVILAEKPQSDGRFLAERAAEKSGGLSLVVVLHEINNPANLGAILRTAEAAGAAGVIITSNSADPFSPKALRGAMGASLRLPVWYGVEFFEAIEWAKSNRMTAACADIKGSLSYTEINWKEPHVLVIGSEARGLKPEEIALCDESFKIPMAEPVESLNAAVAAGIILFEARRAALQQT
jgi:TrmH family RNA methyltransferase